MRARHTASLIAALSALVLLLLSAPARSETIAIQPPLPPSTNVGPAPEIVLYTMGKGSVVWQKFGHGALCVEYPRQLGKSNLCYNYGTTDFTKPMQVGWGFLRGQGEFWVSVTTLRQMIRVYQGFDRTLWRQPIPMSAERARTTAEKLAINALPENRYYTYHHYWDNCTTRIRDLINEATDGALQVGSDQELGPSLREYSRVGFSQDAWLLVATDFFLGRGADHKPTLWEAMFLPRFLRQHVEDRLGVKAEVIYQRRGPQLTEGDSSGRGWVVFLALLLAAPLAFQRWRGGFERGSLRAAVIPLFTMAFILWFLAIITAVEEFRYNENLFLYLPTDLALLFLGTQRRLLYARVRVGMIALASLLMVVGVFTQPLWTNALVVFLPMMFIAMPPRAAGRAAGVGHADEAPDQKPASGHKSGQRAGHKKPKKKKKKKKQGRR